MLNAIVVLVAAYGMFIFVRRHRKMPPGLKHCKFVRLDALRDMANRGLPIRRCQDIPHSFFGDPRRARFLIVTSHRWINPQTCDVPVVGHPTGLRLETMVKKLETFFSPSNFGRGSTWRDRMTLALFSLVNYADVLVFFDFMCVPQDHGPEKHTNIKEHVPETGFDVLPAVPGRRATSHD